MKRFGLLFLFIISFFATYAQKLPSTPITRILFIIDFSQSMTGVWGKEKKIIVARRILTKLVDSMQHIPNVQLALRMYGHQNTVPQHDCNDTRLEVPFDFNNGARIKAKLMNFEPKGITPIARSLELCANDFPPCKNCRNIVILITDGIEVCKGDPCAIAINLYKKGIFLKPFIIGIGLDVELKKAFECMGDYYDADKEERFQSILELVIKQAVTITSAQVNLNDIYGQPTETNVNMTFYDVKTGDMQFNIMHTLNRQGNPDTLFLDPNITYRIDVHTIPPVTIDNIKLLPKKHNIIKQDAPQGNFIFFEESMSNVYKGLKCIVRKNGEMKTLNVQDIGFTEKYIVGKYDLEILTLPRIFYYNVEIKQSVEKKIVIPQPGQLTLITPAAGVGCIMQIVKGKAQWVCNINNMTREVINLQPGKYIAVYRPLNAKSVSMSNSKEFEVLSGRSVMVDFQ